MSFSGACSISRFWESLGLKFLIKPAQEPKVCVPVRENFNPYAGWKEYQRLRETALSKPVEVKPARNNGELSSEWKGLLQKTRKGFIAISYWELGEDLHGQRMTPEKKARKHMLGQFLRYLNFPVGSITFWPPCLGDSYSEAAFWSGIRLLDCRALVIFGSQAAFTVLHDKTLRPLAFKRKNGLLIWIMRSLPAFEAASVREFEWGYLRNGLKKYFK